MAKPSRQRSMQVMTLDEREEVKGSAWAALQSEYREHHIDHRKFQLHSEVYRAWWHRYIERNEYIDFFDYIEWMLAHPGVSY